MSIMPLATFFFIALALLSLLHFYLGRKLLRLLAALWPAANQQAAVTLLMSALALLYPVGRLTEILFPNLPGTLLYNLGAYWLALAIYAFWLLLCGDLAVLLSRHLFGTRLRWPVIPSAACVILLSLATVLYGAWNALTPVVKSYGLTLRKASARPSLHLVLVTDLHLGRSVDAARLQELTDQINRLNPDIILLGGDITDDFVQPLIDQQLDLTLKQLDAPLGVYAVLGNHEYISREPDRVIAWLEAGNVRVLRDQSINVHGIFRLIGRDDYSRKRFTGQDRATLAALLESQDHDLPLLVLDHQPVDYRAAQQLGVDLLLSGHTHHGQFTPNQLITALLYENDWGYWRKGALQTIVSCGYGTWGPPIRVGNRPEIVDIHLQFVPKERRLPDAEPE